MADDLKVRVNIAEKQISFARKVLNALVFWSIPVAAIGLSKVWFGGSWVIDILVFTLLVMIVIVFVAKQTGTIVEMSRDEARAWFEDGMPRDVKGWKERRNG